MIPGEEDPIGGKVGKEEGRKVSNREEGLVEREAPEEVVISSYVDWLS